MDLSYREYGDKNAPLMVFLHGGGVSSWMWDKQIQYFSNYHCITIDLPEQGASRNTENFSIQLSAEKVNRLIEKIADGKKIIVIGFSLGAQVTIQMLSNNSNLINFAIVNSALARPNSFIRKMIKPSIKLFFPLVKNKTFSKLQASTGIIIPNVGHGISLKNPNFFNQMIENWIQDFSLPQGVVTIK
ncbi:alpha/beta fold hydrolase [Solibacillus sp. FSL K6-1126]|uniref:alpha/beta fold hydrolase n=1 Tax=Solibacillus sp. FSL K6-1126 TaxID=2921463 RepID=UPI0030F523AD